jgi:predicted flap endonuclease-1-like 5' DNA nuclease
MRSDYALYAVSIIFFIITALVLMINTLAEFERSLSAISTVILGLLFIALGYSQRPRLTTTMMTTPEPQATTAATPILKEETVLTPAPVGAKTELTQVKGIKEKRAGQLKALGINDAEELANASATELATKLKIAPYFTEQWIANAKKLVAES